MPTIYNFKIDDRYEDVILETCLDKGMSRPRVKPLNSQIFPEDIRVEFPRNLREGNPIGTRFRADLKVSQKSNKSNGFPIGPPYLVVDVKTIKIVEDFTPEIRLKAVRLKTASDRVYIYVKDNTLETPILAASRIWHKNMRKL